MKGARHGGGIAAVLDEGKRRLLHPRPARRGELVERRQPPGREALGETAGLEEEQLGQVQVSLDHSLRLDHARLRRPQGRGGDRPCPAELIPRHRRAERRRDAAGRSLELGGAIRARRAGEQRAADAAHARDQRIRRKAAADPGQVLIRDGERSGASREPPPGRLGRRADLGVGRGWIAQEQGEKLAAPDLALALLLALGLRVALDRIGRELVDVGEDRLGQQRRAPRGRPWRAGPPPRPAARRPGRRRGRRTGASRASAPP